MASLTNTKIKDTYDGLLKTTDNDALGGTYKLITDGLGNSSGVYLGTGGNVGIGQSSPTTYKLDVNGTFRAVSTAYFESGINAASYIYHSSDTNTFFGFPANDTFTVTTNNVERMRIDSSGNVGIGTSSSDTLLHTFGSGNVAKFETTSLGGINLSRENNVGNHSTHYVISFNNSDSEIAYIKTLNKTGGTTSTGTGYEMQFATPGSGYQTFYTNGTERMRIDSSGNVGIGTTNPSEKLEVIGNAVLDNDNAKLKIKGGGVDTVGSIDFTFNTDSTQYGLIDLDYNSRSSQGFRMKSLYPITLDGVTRQKFLISGSEKMRIESSGNVGIGTTNPSTKLHVYESNSLDHITIDGNNGDNRNLRFATENSTRWNLYATGTSETGSNVGSDLTIAKYTDAGAYNGNVLTIKRNTGNVGIGRTPTSHILEINGEMKIVGLGASEGIDAFNDASRQWGIKSTSAGTDSGMKFEVQNSESMRIDSSGNVGIGTSSPAGKLAIKDGNVYIDRDTTSGNYAFGFYRSGAERGRLGFDYSSSTLNLQADGVMTFLTSGENEQMRITSAGRIHFYNLLGSSATQSDVRYDTTSKELFYNTSSERYKTEIVDLENTLDKVNSLRAVRYKDIETEQETTGLIAEEVIQIIPEVVLKKEVEGFDEPQPEGINYSDFAPFLIKAIQELKAEIETLKSQINS